MQQDEKVGKNAVIKDEKFTRMAYGIWVKLCEKREKRKFHADGGIWDGERILSEEYVKMDTSLQNGSATEKLVNPEAYDNFVGYGYQICMCRPKGVYRADGAMGQFTIVDPGRELILAIKENASGAHWAQRSLDVIWEFLDKIREEKLPRIQTHI